MLLCLPSKAIVYLMHHAINSVERMFVLRPQCLDARLQTAGSLLMGKPSDDTLVVQEKGIDGGTHVSIIKGVV
jgi:hypothetical protein